MSAWHYQDKLKAEDPIKDQMESPKTPRKEKSDNTKKGREKFLDPGMKDRATSGVDSIRCKIGEEKHNRKALRGHSPPRPPCGPPNAINIVLSTPRSKGSEITIVEFIRRAIIRVTSHSHPGQSRSFSVLPRKA